MILLHKFPYGALATTIALLLLMSVAASAVAADHFEIQVKLDSTFESPARTNEHEVTAICILGTNDWYISGQFMDNAQVEYWLIGTNVFERKTVTSSMYVQQAKDMISEKLGTKAPQAIAWSYPHKGQTSTRTNSWLEPFGYGMERSVWLAFCSGSFLHMTNRQVPLPFGHFLQSLGRRDETVFLTERSAFSLPKNVDLFAPGGVLVAHYEVLASTNIASAIIPLQFNLIQYGNPEESVGANRTRYNLRGRVISIKPCEGPPAFDMKLGP
jgi:hypothetical protein